MDQEKVSCIWVNTRELDGDPSTKLFTTLLLAYPKSYILFLRSTC